MNGFLTPDNPSSLFLPQYEKVISDLKLPFTRKYNFRLLEDLTKCDVTISDSTLYKLNNGENVGKNANMKLRELYLQSSKIYQPTTSTQALVAQALTVRSNATDWLYFLDGFSQSQDVAAWTNTIGFLYNRCLDDIDLFQKIKRSRAEDQKLSTYMQFLKDHSLIPENLIDNVENTVKQKNSRHKQPLDLSSTIDTLLFTFHLQIDFLFSAAAHFERDLDIPHLDLDPSYVPCSRINKTIEYYIDCQSETKDYRNLFGSFFCWLIEYMPKPDGSRLTWSELARCIPLPDDGESAETLKKRQYDELKKWRTAKTKRHKPSNQKLAVFLDGLFGVNDDKPNQADVVFIIVKFLMLLDNLILEWQQQVDQVKSETGYDAEIDSAVLIHSVLTHYQTYWLRSAETKY